MCNTIPIFIILLRFVDVVKLSDSSRVTHIGLHKKFAFCLEKPRHVQVTLCTSDNFTIKMILRVIKTHVCNIPMCENDH